MLKLRTMVADSDALLEQHLRDNPAARVEWDSTQKLKNDPRITRMGRFLRKTSMDELPQLWNVIAGDMSLVGPRPMMPDQQHLYPGIAYYSLRPGLTGPWQVTARNESEFCKRSEYDQAYDKELSLGTDILLLIRTLGVVMKGTGY
jgi:lipopolysaccharide/colanic/teichoic acid biosynthesis glycosyltransferase